MTIAMKTVLFFVQGESGWSETFYRQEPDFTTAEASAKRLADARGKCLASKDWVQMTAIRLSDDNVRGDARLITGYNYKTTEALNDPNVNPDVPWTGVVIRIEAGEKIRRHLWMRGVPDDAIVEPFRRDNFPPFTVALSAFLKFLILERYQVRNFDKTDVNPAAVITKVERSTTGLPGQWDLTLGVGGPTFNAGEEVFIEGIKESNGLNGQKPCILVNNTLGKMTIFADKIIPDFLYLGKGKVRHVRYKFDDITRAEWIRNGHRDNGRPFDSPRGRRKIGIK